MTIQQLKDVYNEFSNCEYLRVDPAGKILAAYDVVPDLVCVDKRGDVHIKYYKNAYGDVAIQKLNEVLWSVDGNLEGVFTNKSVAVATAREHYLKIKQDRIAEVEAELLKMKEDLEEYKSSMKED